MKTHSIDVYMSVQKFGEDGVESLRHETERAQVAFRAFKLLAHQEPYVVSHFWSRHDSCDVVMED